MILRVGFFLIFNFKNWVVVLLNPYNKGCVNYIVALPFTLKGILRQKKNNENSNTNTSPCKNIIFKKQSSKRNQINPSRYYYNSITNLKFQQKPKSHLSKIFI
jgi:hypothetical protein